MTMARNLAASLVAVLLLSACQGEEKAPAAGTAEGQILEGSASDAMLPLDTLRSQPPLAPRPSASGKDDAADVTGSGEKPEAGETPVAPATPASAATPNAG